MHLQDTGNRLINDKQTDNDFLINKQIMKNPISRLKGVLFSKVGYDPTTLHRSKVKEWTTKLIYRNKISQVWANFIVNEDAVAPKNSMLYKTYTKQPGTPFKNWM